MILLLVTAITTALIAGLFYAWTCSVTTGLALLPDSEYISAMQSLNRAILNPLFFASFFGTTILLPVSTYMQYEQPLPSGFWYLLAATVIYLLGVLGVTMIGNVPLNNALDSFNISTSSVEEIATRRHTFELNWNRLNTIRTIASIISLVLVLLTCMNRTGLGKH